MICKPLYIHKGIVKILLSFLIPSTAASAASLMLIGGNLMERTKNIRYEHELMKLLGYVLSNYF